jgi:hypothetical protein
MQSKTMPCVLLLALLSAAVSFGQTGNAAKKSAPKAQHASSFTCPDPDAEQACKSYQELVKANDAALYEDAYYCFRKKQDQFFFVWFSKPYFRKHWDSENKCMAPDDAATSVGRGSAGTFTNGVEDYSAMPRLVFKGTWSPWPLSAQPDAGLFSSTSIRIAGHWNDDSGVISVDVTQFSIDRLKYQNTLGETIQYDLTIQRSTGRFTESFSKPLQGDETKQVPFGEGTGRCIYRKGS